MESAGLSQVEVAKRAEVSQSTVSRALKRSPARSSRAHARLCNYIQQETEKMHVPEGLIDAIGRVWDGTVEHAEALRGLIESSQRLWPDLASEEE